MYCNLTSGALDTSAYTKPIPFVGLYITMASVCVIIAMIIDFAVNIMRKQWWFPCHYFSLNATSLTALSITTILAADLGTKMPGRLNQLSKISSTVLICTAMVNFMPSLGGMDDSNMQSNVAALCLFLISIIGNVITEMSTGVIYLFQPEHLVIISLMLVHLVITFLSGLTIQETKKILEKKFDMLHNLIEEEDNLEDKYTVEKLKKRVNKYMLMARTCSPQHVLARTDIFPISNGLCVVSFIVLIQAFIRTFTQKSMKACDGESDYEWSTHWIYIFQAVTTFVGTCVSVGRLVYARKIKILQGVQIWKVENYWTVKLVKWKESPLTTHGPRMMRRALQDLKVLTLNVLISTQYLILVASKLFCVAISCCLKNGTSPRVSSGSIAVSEEEDLRRFIVYLQGEEGLLEVLMSGSEEECNELINHGREKKPVNLIDFMSNSTRASGFQGPIMFSISALPNDHSTSWSLVLVSLTSIAVSLSTDHNDTVFLLKAVKEGLLYVRLVETFFPPVKCHENMHQAVDCVWASLELHEKWFDINLCAIAETNENNAQNIILVLAQIGESIVQKFQEQFETVPNDLEWPSKEIAAQSLYQISTSLLLYCQRETPSLTVKGLFCHLKVIISNVLCACLTNMPQVVSRSCFQNYLEQREHAASLLGETENIMQILEVNWATFDIDYPVQKEYFDSWFSHSSYSVISEEDPDEYHSTRVSFDCSVDTEDSNNITVVTE